MKKLLILLMCLLAVVGVQPRLFAPLPTAELEKLRLSQEEDTVDVATETEQEEAQEQADEDNDEADDQAEHEGEREGEEDAESEIPLNSEEVDFIDECVDNAKEALNNAKRRLKILTDAYYASPYVLLQSEFDNVREVLKACVEDYNMFAGTNFELKEAEEEQF